MSWPGRTRRRSVGPAPPPTPSDRAPRTRSSPGLAALFEALHADGRHSILDLGSAGARPLRLLGRFGRQIRFAGLLPRMPDDRGWLERVLELPPNPRRPYDVVLAWDLLDRLAPAERSAAMARISQVTAPRARLYTVVDASGSSTTHPLSYTLVDLDRVAERVAGSEHEAHEQLLPAQVERTLSPFQVTHAFTLRTGLREYVALKE